MNIITLHAASLIDRVYEFSQVGGRLHVIIDDHNLDDEHFEYTFKSLDDPPDDWNSAESLDAQKKCLEFLWHLTIEERWSAIAIQDGYIGQETDIVEANVVCGDKLRP